MSSWLEDVRCWPLLAAAKPGSALGDMREREREEMLELQPALSRALARDDTISAYLLLKAIGRRIGAPRGWAGRALLALIRTEPEWRERVRRATARRT